MAKYLLAIAALGAIAAATLETIETRRLCATAADPADCRATLSAINSGETVSFGRP